MSENWTKGPWEAVPAHRVGFVIESANNIIVDSTDEEGRYGAISEEANAHLIAAAPEMYAALKAIIDDLPISRDWLDPVNERWAKDALKKARGES